MGQRLRIKHCGLTLLELMITIVLSAMLMGVTVYIFRAVLLTWSSSEKRAGIDISLDKGIEEMARDLRTAKAIQSANDELRFTVYQNSSDTNYIYYLYNKNDIYPPRFNQDVYQIKKTALSGNISSSFEYGSGQIIVTDVIPPPTSDLSLNNNITTIDLSISQDSERIRSRTKIRPRNL